jgi:hypothetical protein
MSVPFWINDPTIILNKEYIFELWPSKEMCYEKKINAITRLIIFISIIGYLLTMSTRILFVGLVTVLAIFIYFKIRKLEKKEGEGFVVVGDNVYGLLEDKTMNQKINNSEKKGDNTVITNPATLGKALRKDFKNINKKNPFSNVLLTEIMDDPERKAAAPCFNPEVEEDITKNVKKSVQFMNPEIKNTNKQLYGDLWENFNLDQSNRIFYSTANTRVTNDQGAYAQFLYGNMPSGKSSGPDGDFARVQDNYRYTLY